MNIIYIIYKNETLLQKITEEKKHETKLFSMHSKLLFLFLNKNKYQLIVFSSFYIFFSLSAFIYYYSTWV